MKKIVSVLCGILIILSVAYGVTYTLTVDDGMSKVVNQIEYNDEVTVGLPNEQNGVDYIVKDENGNVINDLLIDVDSTKKKFNMPAKNIFITLQPGKRLLTVSTNFGELLKTKQKVNENVNVSAEIIEGYDFVNWTATGITL